MNIVIGGLDKTNGQYSTVVFLFGFVARLAIKNRSRQQITYPNQQCLSEVPGKDFTPKEPFTGAEPGIDACKSHALLLSAESFDQHQRGFR